MTNHEKMALELGYGQVSCTYKNPPNCWSTRKECRGSVLQVVEDKEQQSIYGGKTVARFVNRNGQKAEKSV